MNARQQWKRRLLSHKLLVPVLLAPYGSNTIGYMKTMIDLDEQALEQAARELGTKTKKDTVNSALAFVAQRRRRIEQLLGDPLALGVGSDITDAELMRQARR